MTVALIRSKSSKTPVATKPDDPLRRFPAEVVCEILEYLEPYTVVCMSMVSREWKITVEQLCIGATAEKVLGRKECGVGMVGQNARSRNHSGQWTDWEAFRRMAKTQHTRSQGRPEHIINYPHVMTTKNMVFWEANQSFCIRNKKGGTATEKENDTLISRVPLREIYTSIARDPDGYPILVREETPGLALFYTALGYEDEIVVFHIMRRSARFPLTIPSDGVRLIAFDLRRKRVLWIREDTDILPVRRSTYFRNAIPIHNFLFTYAYSDTVSDRPYPIAVIHAQTGQIISKHIWQPNLNTPIPRIGDTVFSDHMISSDGMFYVVTAKIGRPRSTGNPPPWHDTLLLIGDSITGKIVGSFKSMTTLKQEDGFGRYDDFPTSYGIGESYATIMSVGGISGKSDFQATLDTVDIPKPHFEEDSPKGVISADGRELRIASRHEYALHKSDSYAHQTIVGTRENLIEKRRLWLDRVCNDSGEYRYSTFITLFEYHGDKEKMLYHFRENLGFVVQTKIFQITLHINKTTSNPSELPPFSLNSSSSSSSSSPPGSSFLPEEQLGSPIVTTELKATMRQKQERTYFIPAASRDSNTAPPYICRYVDIGPNLQWALHRYTSIPNGRAGLEIITFREEEVHGDDVEDDSNVEETGQGWHRVKRFRMVVDKSNIVSLTALEAQPRREAESRQGKSLYYYPSSSRGNTEHQERMDEFPTPMVWRGPVELREEEGEIVLHDAVLFF